MYRMRWDGQSVRVDDGALPGLQRMGLVRSVCTPQFDGITFHEVLCKSALNKVPGASMLPFRYTVNGYRGGCSHACRYCFARPTHEYLEFDSGTDFDTQVVVKTNVVAVLQRELARPSWTRETVALGTNTDPYQRAEGRYALMPGILRALAASGAPFSILTKGTLLRRDLPLIAEAAQLVSVNVSLSLAIGGDPELHRAVEPGTPVAAGAPGLDLRGARGRAGLSCDGGTGVAAADRFTRATRRSAAPDRRSRRHRGDGLRPASARLDTRLVHAMAATQPPGAGVRLPPALPSRRVPSAGLSRHASYPGCTVGGPVRVDWASAHGERRCRFLRSRGTGAPHPVLGAPAFDLIERHPAVGGGLAREAEHPFTDDVARHLRTAPPQ